MTEGNGTAVSESNDQPRQAVGSDDRRREPSRIDWRLILTNAGASLGIIVVFFYASGAYREPLAVGLFVFMVMPGALVLGAVVGLLAQLISPLSQLKYGLRALIPGALTAVIGLAAVFLPSQIDRSLRRPSVESLAFSPDGTRIATNADFDLYEWDVESGRQLVDIQGASHSMGGLCRLTQYSRDGRQILVSTGRDVQLCDTGSMQCRGIGRYSGSNIRHVVGGFLPDGVAVVQDERKAGEDWLPSLVDIDTGQSLVILEGTAKGTLTWAAFDPDGTRVATGFSDGTILVHDTGTGQQLLAISAHDEGVDTLVFSPNGDRIASGGSGSVLRVWDADTGEKLADLIGHRGLRIESVAFGPDGERLLSAGTDSVIVWDLESEEQLLALDGNGAAGWSPSGDRIAAATGDGIVTIWNAENGEKVTEIRMPRDR